MNHPKIRAIVEHVSGGRMPEGMRVNAFYAGSLAPFANDPWNCPRVYSHVPHREKQGLRAIRFSSPMLLVVAGVLEQSLKGLLPERADSFLVAVTQSVGLSSAVAPRPDGTRQRLESSFDAAAETRLSGLTVTGWVVIT